MGPHMVELFKGGVRKIGPGEKSRVFSRFSKKGTAVESIEIAPSYSSIKKSILSRFVNIENFEKLKNRKTQIKMSLA